MFFFRSGKNKHPSRPKPLFVCGLPRSGTTLLARLIGSHPKIVLGVERYRNLYHSKRLRPRHLTQDRFLDIREGDGNPVKDQQLKSFAERFATARYVGDKFPGIYRHYEFLHSTFPDARFVFIVRDPISVGRSWDRRAQNAEDVWKADNDFSKSLDLWMDSIRRTTAARHAGTRISAVSYHELISLPVEGCAATLSRLFEDLDLEMHENVHARLAAEHKRSKDIEATRPPPSEDQCEHVESRMEHAEMNSLLDELGLSLAGLTDSVRHRRDGVCAAVS